MRMNVYNDENTVINIIEIDDNCVIITQSEKDNMPLEEFLVGNFYTIPDGYRLELAKIDDTYTQEI